jgi:hypothetical protein
MVRFILTELLLIISFCSVKAQIVINEISNRNYKQIADEDGDYNDWIELYNAGNKEVNLNGLAISDSKADPGKWKFGNTVIPASGFLLIQASGKDRNSLAGSTWWESAVLPENDFRYLIPDNTTSTSWYQNDFNDESWKIGKAGFGYADGDDQTVVPEQTLAVYLRKKFIVPDTAAILAGVFHIDYDDGFIAYLNGIEIARSNMNDNPVWNSVATASHEAIMYSGGTPERFNIDIKQLKNILRKGENLLSVEVHNQNATSTDLSVIPFLSFAISGNSTFFQPAPSWLNQAQSGILHTNFKLSHSGGMIYLTDNFSVVDSLGYTEMQLDQSTGRITNGSNQTGIFTKATPGSSNASSSAFTEGYAVKPKFNQKAGFYPSPIDLTLTSTDGKAVIRYTMDGSVPVETSTRYTIPLKITKTQCIKARCFSTGKLPGEVVTTTFLINEVYTIPVLSVSTNNSNLYGTDGIFSNMNESWNVPSYVEYFEKDKGLAFHLQAGMQLDGGAGGSRSLEQHSFRIEPGHRTLGDGSLNYRLMPARPNRTNYPSFYVRNGSNQYLILPYKDALEVTALGRNTYTYYSAYHPIVVYLNGKYFGVYELREKINEDFLKDNYQMDTDSFDFLGVSYFKGSQLEAIRGSVDPFLFDYKRFMQMNAQSADFLDKVGEFFDLQNYTDYIIAESWVANDDWPQNNIKVFRCKGTGFRWRWAINDLEWGLNPNGWTTYTFDHIQYMLGTNYYYSNFWIRLMKNQEYKAYFINRFADLMNTSYSFSSIGSLETEMYNEIFPEMGGEYKRWGTSNISGQLTTFTNNHLTFRSELKKRSDVVRKNLQTHFNLSRQVVVTLDVEPKEAGSIQISTITPSNYPWEGIYFSNVPVKVTALPNLGYQFTSWDANSFIGDINQASITNQFLGTKITLKAHFGKIENSNGGIVISEINYKSGNGINSPDWLELYNLGSDQVNLKGWYFTCEDTFNVFTFNKDFIFPANQRLVITNKRDLFKKLYPDVEPYSGEFYFDLKTTSGEIHLFNSENQQVFSVRYSDQYPWPLSDDFSGRTLEFRSPDGDKNDPASWFRGCIGGSPGEAFQPCQDPVVSAPVIRTNNHFDVNVFPIPASDYVDLKIMLEDDVEYCDAKIYNLMGSELKSISLGGLRNGFYQTRIELDGIHESILILRVATNRNIKTIKIGMIK